VSGTLGPIPPLDPRSDAVRRRRVRTEASERLAQSGLALLLALFQLTGVVLAGYWAAGGFASQSTVATHAAVGMGLVLLGAHAAGYGALLVFGGVALLARLPRLFRRARRDTGANGAPREDAAGKVMIAGVVAVHAAALLAGTSLLWLLLTVSSDSVGIGAGWRFLLAALAPVPLTAWILIAWSRSDL
jgi:hypothetical protein